MKCVDFCGFSLFSELKEPIIVNCCSEY